MIGRKNTPSVVHLVPGQGASAPAPLPDPDAALAAEVAAVRAHLAEIGTSPDDPVMRMLELNARASLASVEASCMAGAAFRDAKRADDAALVKAAEDGLMRAMPRLRWEIRKEYGELARWVSWRVSAMVGAVIVAACLAVHWWDVG